MNRIFVEKKAGFNTEAKELFRDLKENLGLSALETVRCIQRYDVDRLSPEEFEEASRLILSEPQVEQVSSNLEVQDGDIVFAIEYLPGQFDQRADSAAQCVQILTQKERPLIASAKTIVLTGKLTDAEVESIKDYVINQVDSREASLSLPSTLETPITEPAPVARLENFNTASEDDITQMAENLGLAMTPADLLFCQKYFRDEEGRVPSLTEIRMLDTYWSDHCRHTTFATEITDVSFEQGAGAIEKSYRTYQATRELVYGKDTDRKETLMDIALMGMKELRRSGELDNLEVSEEINAASIDVTIKVDGEEQNWLVMFKNETHNHPTEIEPFGGAATCLGGCIRDPLSGRSYVYQAMRVTGAADPTAAFEDTLPGKLPQRKICQGAAHGYSSYGNQIGLATGEVAEVYHPRYVAKRMEIGAVVAAAPRENVFRGTPANGDYILLIGGRTGRDGVGGATGSSKEHTETALENSAEVQKGDPPTERKVQRLFRDAELAPKIKRCNDFGAGGISVAIGELADSLDINLDHVLKKYDGLDGTELAISESQERMAIVITPTDLNFFLQKCKSENLECVHVAEVKDHGRLRMTWKGDEIVNLSRAFLETNGVQMQAQIKVTTPKPIDSPLRKPLPQTPDSATLTQKALHTMADLNQCSQKGLGEQFDASIGAGTVLHPFGGKTQMTPPNAMVAKIPVLKGKTDACTYMSWGFNPRIACWSPYHGAIYAVTESVCKIIASGAKLEDIRLTFQEYFEKLGQSPERWGKPFSALLGAYEVQHALRLAAIGGKDSMSGSFKEIDVPPTLVSFAVAPGSSERALSPEFKEAGNVISLIQIERDENGIPLFEQLREFAGKIYQECSTGNTLSIQSLDEGGLVSGLSKMCFGNMIGADVSADDFFQERYAGFLVESKKPLPKGMRAEIIGQTVNTSELIMNDEAVSLSSLLEAYRSPLEGVYPSQIPTPPTKVETFRSDKTSSPRTKPVRSPRPRVIIPVFPGTNCEYDTARVFEEAGAEAQTLVFQNLNPAAVEESLQALAEAINQSEILMIPGGFSAGDEPAGSGKFIATVLRNPVVRDSVMNLLKKREGLILGICNGFQALIKTGLVPYGEIRDPQADAPTLCHNDISRHVSSYVTTRICSKLSPWLSECHVDQLHHIPVSHGEGKFYASPAMIAELAAKGQIATQYTNHEGEPLMDISVNPNGSVHAIEGISSPCGHVLGKMGHSERQGSYIAKNIPGIKDQKIFKSGVQYFL